MADPVHEGDTIQLFCSEAEGFVYAQSPRYRTLIMLYIYIVMIIVNLCFNVLCHGITDSHDQC